MYGWPFGSAGALALAFSVGPFVAVPSNYRLTQTDLQISALVALAGLVTVAWELWRRRSRVVLVPVRGGVGVYRRGALQNVASPSQITLYKWSDRYLLAYVGLVFYLLIMGVATVGMDRPGAETAFDLLLGVLVGAWLASHIWVRSSLTRLWLPTLPGKVMPILVQKRLLPLLFAPASGVSSTRR
jgi:hypothetical protein